MWIFIVILAAAVLAGILGRCGGAEKKAPDDGWNWLRNTHTRDKGIAAIFTALMVWMTIKDFNWLYLGAYIIGFLALMGALTTYLDEVFGYDNYWAAGALVGFSAVLYPGVSGHWIGFVLRMGLLVLIWGLLHKYLPKKVLYWGKDVAEEFLRYASVILTIRLLFKL